MKIVFIYIFVFIEKETENSRKSRRRRRKEKMDDKCKYQKKRPERQYYRPPRMQRGTQKSKDIKQSPPHTAGIIRLPPQAAASFTSEKEPSPTNVKSKPQNQPEVPCCSFPVENKSQQQLGAIQSRQLFDPYNTNKPCVMIRPTPHIPYNQMPCPLRPHLFYQQMIGADINHDMLSIQWPHHYIHNPRDPRLPQMLFNRFEYPNQPSNIPGVLPMFTMENNLSEASMSKRKMKTIVEKNMNEILQLEKNLNIYLSGERPADEQFIEQCRWKIQKRYENVILADPQFCADNSLEQMLWKSAFFQFIEIYRRNIGMNINVEQSKKSLIKIIDEATIFFENVIERLQETFDFSIDKYIDQEYDREYPKYESIKYAALSAQKNLIYLGDLVRYKEQAQNTVNFGKARR